MLALSACGPSKEFLAELEQAKKEAEEAQASLKELEEKFDDRINAEKATKKRRLLKMGTLMKGAAERISPDQLGAFFEGKDDLVVINQELEKIIQGGVMVDQVQVNAKDLYLAVNRWSGVFRLKIFLNEGGSENVIVDKTFSTEKVNIKPQFQNENQEPVGAKEFIEKLIQGHVDLGMKTHPVLKQVNPLDRSADEAKYKSSQQEIFSIINAFYADGYVRGIEAWAGDGNVAPTDSETFMPFEIGSQLARGGYHQIYVSIEPDTSKSRKWDLSLSLYSGKGEGAKKLKTIEYSSLLTMKPKEATPFSMWVKVD